MAAKPKDRQQRFVEEYLVDLDATQAAIRAGYSAKTAGQIGWQLLQKTSIKEAIKEAIKARSERTEITADWALRRLKEEADFVGEGASHSARVTAIGLAMKHLQLLPDTVKHTGTGKDGAMVHEHHYLPSLTPEIAADAERLAQETDRLLQGDGGAKSLDTQGPPPEAG